jgi:hypothetical protein
MVNRTHPDRKANVMKIRITTLACATVAALFAADASAEIDTACLDKWQLAVTAASVGQKCKLGDAATTAKLKSVEDANLQCAGAKATADEKGTLTTNAEKTKGLVVKNMADMPCGADAKKYFDAQVGQLAK